MSLIRNHECSVPGSVFISSVVRPRAWGFSTCLLTSDAFVDVLISCIRLISISMSQHHQLHSSLDALMLPVPIIYREPASSASCTDHRQGSARGGGYGESHVGDRCRWVNTSCFTRTEADRVSFINMVTPPTIEVRRNSRIIHSVPSLPSATHGRYCTLLSYFIAWCDNVLH
jgi:hypothetical protein